MARSTDDNTVSAETRPWPWLISLAFWLSLLVAASLYGLVALSPKILTWIQISSKHYANQVRLVQLQDQIDHLEQVAHALEYDRSFAAELARVDLHASRPGDERIPVDAELTLSSGMDSPAPARPKLTLPWYTPVIERCAVDRTLRAGLLCAAALTVVLSFTFLHEQYESQMRSGIRVVCTGMQKAVARYRAPADDM